MQYIQREGEGGRSKGEREREKDYNIDTLHMCVFQTSSFSL